MVALNVTVRVPAGTFRNCLQTQETTLLETDLLEQKYYAPGIGNVLTVFQKRRPSRAGQDNDELGRRVVDLTVCVVTRGGARQGEDDLGVIELGLQLQAQ